MPGSIRRAHLDGLNSCLYIWYGFPEEEEEENGFGRDGVRAAKRTGGTTCCRVACMVAGYSPALLLYALRCAATRRNVCPRRGNTYPTPATPYIYLFWFPFIHSSPHMHRNAQKHTHHIHNTQNTTTHYRLDHPFIHGLTLSGG